MKKIFSLLCFFISSGAIGQNLVSNPDFETFSGLPTNVGEYYLATGWDNCDGGGSPDYFHINGSGLVQLPNSFVGIVHPWSGDAIMGFAPYYAFNLADFREYLSTNLATPLIPGNTYNVSFHITNGITAGGYGGQGIDKVSVAFTINQPNQNGTLPILSVVPQWTTSAILYDTAWQLISFQFTASDAFDFITFGNFVNDANTNAQIFDAASSPVAYYYLDGISVEEANQGNPGFVSTDTAVCEKFCIDFTDSSTNNPTQWLWSFEGGSPASSTDQNPVNICYNSPGLYDVTLITANANGNDTLSLPDYITVYPTPPLPTITQTGYTLTCSNASNYQWQFNGIDIPGATDQSYEVSQSGVYIVIITDENGCSSSANTSVVIAGVDDVLSGLNVSIYPNPSNGNFMVELLNGQMVDEAVIQIHSTLGQIVFSSKENIQNNHFLKTIDVLNWPAGIYFLELKYNGASIKKKLIKTN